jgi:predicted dehydrogenase
VPLLIVGRGWGDVYARTLKKMKVPFWQTTRDWHCYVPSGVIVATPPETHYEIAKCCLGRRIPVLIEKPVTLKPAESQALLEMGGIVFAGHARLYSPAWREFKAKVGKASEVEAWAGGTHRDPWWDWGPHLVAMSMDLGCHAPVIHVGKEEEPVRLHANGHTYTDVETDPTPLEVLCGEFLAAIEKGEPNNEGLQLGHQVIQFLENQCPSQTTQP